MEEFRQKLILAAFTALIMDPKSQLSEQDIAGYAVGYADATLKKAYPNKPNNNPHCSEGGARSDYETQSKNRS